jgi:hypothetical protein
MEFTACRLRFRQNLQDRASVFRRAHRQLQAQMT